jgi:hypothetical protein
MDAATRLDDLREPPGNMLEPLRGKRRGQYSIRINDQFRICFVWKEDGAYDVEIVDYHGERKGGKYDARGASGSSRSWLELPVRDNLAGRNAG